MVWALLFFLFHPAPLTAEVRPKIKKQTRPCVELWEELNEKDATGFSLGLYRKGTEIPPNERAAHGLAKLNLPDGAKLFLLGGGSNARVFRVIPPKGKSYILRVYEQMTLHHVVDPSEANFRRDREWLARFAKASAARGPTETLETLNVTETFDDTRTIKAEDFRGHNLALIFAALLHDALRYRTLVREFNSRLDHFVEDLRAEGVEVFRGTPDPSHPDVHLYYTRIAGEKFEIGNLSNVLFEPETGRFLISDPF